MKNAILLHGQPSREEYYAPDMPSMSNAHWFPWLQKQLLINDIAAATPEVPKCYASAWEDWVREVERYDINAETVLVGHSTGGGFWVRYLSEHPELEVGKVMLVAPWLDPDGDETEGMFNFSIDPKLVSRTDGFVVFHSDNDMGNVHKSVAIIREKINDVTYKEFHQHGHFCEKDLQSKEFPELLEEILSSRKLH